MAICYFRVTTIGRAKGSRAVSAAAYRSGSRLYDDDLRRAFDFTHKPNVIYSEILAPSLAAQETWPDQARLWNAVEAREKRKDSQLAREVIVAIPRELDKDQGLALVRAFVQRTFVEQGMIADLNVHWDMAKDGKPNPHAHIMLTMRRIVGDAGQDAQFGLKVAEWNKLPLIMQWRQAWSEQVNAHLARLQIDAQIDHRSNQSRSIALEPQRHLSMAAIGMERQGKISAEAQLYRQTARRNGERLAACPAIGLSALTRQHATFTAEDLERFAHYHSDSKRQFDQVLAALFAAPELIVLGRGAQGVVRYTSLDMLDVEQRLERSARAMAQLQGHGVSWRFVEAALSRSEREGLVLSQEQRDAVIHVTLPRGLSAMVGYAGAGKGAALGVARQAWTAQGYRVRGAALSGIAAENLQEGAEIPSRTLASLEYAWSQGRDALTARDVLVIDEAGLVGTRQMQAVIEHAQRAGAKVVLVGDVEQLQAIEAGAAFRMMVERHGAVEITAIRRQYEPWQAVATQDLARGRVDQALDAYLEAGRVQVHRQAAQAHRALIEDWAMRRLASPTHSHLILAHSRDEVRQLNRQARTALRQQGRLGGDHAVITAGGERFFAVQDQIVFQRNSRDLGVKNGTAGQIESLQAGKLEVRLDDGRKTVVHLERYNHLDHGYATTVHRAQGLTVDHVHVLASRQMDRHSAYVALSRHRHDVVLHYTQEQFASHTALAQSFGRDRPKDMALDHVEAFAARRALTAPSASKRFKPAWADMASSSAPSLLVALQTYAAAVIDIQRTRREGDDLCDGQLQDFNRATQAILDLWPGAAGDLARVLEKNPGLFGQIAQGQVSLAAAALQAERADLGGSTPRDTPRPLPAPHGSARTR